MTLLLPIPHVELLISISSIGLDYSAKKSLLKQEAEGISGRSTEYMQPYFSLPTIYPYLTKHTILQSYDYTRKLLMIK